MMRAAATIGAAGALLLVPFLASAHATGVSFQKEQDGYTVDVGYSSPSPQVGDSVQFNFLLRKGTDDVPFADAWVKVSDAQGNVVLATGVHNNPFGGPRLSYVFPKAGTYTVDVRYETDTDTITESSFTIPVLPATVAWYANPSVWLAVLLALEALTAAALVFVLVRRRP